MTSRRSHSREASEVGMGCSRTTTIESGTEASDRKSTRLNSSHANISYAVFCLKKNDEHALALTCTAHTILCHRYTAAAGVPSRTVSPQLLVEFFVTTNALDTAFWCT